MIVEFDGKDYQFDLDEIDVTQARFILRKFNMTLMDLEDGLERANPEALVALYWLMLAQNGTIVDPDKVNFKIVRFGIALKVASDKESEANPTEGAAEVAPETT